MLAFESGDPKRAREWMEGRLREAIASGELERIENAERDLDELTARGA